MMRWQIIVDGTRTDVTFQFLESAQTWLIREASNYLESGWSLHSASHPVWKDEPTVDTSLREVVLRRDDEQRSLVIARERTAAQPED